MIGSKLPSIRRQHSSSGYKNLDKASFNDRIFEFARSVSARSSPSSSPNLYPRGSFAGGNDARGGNRKFWERETDGFWGRCRRVIKK